MTEHISAQAPYENGRQGAAYPHSNPRGSATAADLRLLLAYVPVNFPGEAADARLRRDRLAGWLEREIYDLERLVYVFRAAGAGWEIGPVGRTQVHVTRVPKALSVVHAVLASAGPVPASSFVRRGARDPRNALRGAIREGVLPWLRLIDSRPLEAVARRIRVARSGLVTLAPGRGDPRFLLS